MNAMLTKYISLPLALLVMAFAITACNNDLEQAEENKGKVDVVLNINTRAAGDNTAEPIRGEGIHTLRIIVANTQESIEVNKVLSFDGADPITTETITLHGLESGKHKFYIIANEASLSDEAQRTLAGNNLRSILNTMTYSTIFPCQDAPQTGLPMVGQLVGDGTGVEISEANPQVDPVQLRYMVSKIVLTIHNETGAVLNLDEVKYKYLAKGTSLFGKNKMSNIVSDAERVFLTVTELPADQPVSLTYYFYPTSLELETPLKKALQIALETKEGKSYDFAEVVGQDGADMASIEPHQQVNINGKITSSGSLLLTCEVAEWETGNDIHLDYSNLVSYSSTGWENGLEVSPEGVVSIDQVKDNILKFKIQSPKGATWSAELNYIDGGDKDENRFTINPTSGTVDGKEQSITVTCNPDNIEKIKAELIIQVANVMNNRWPIYLYPSSGDTMVDRPDGRKHYTLELSH